MPSSRVRELAAVVALAAMLTSCRSDPGTASLVTQTPAEPVALTIRSGPAELRLPARTRARMLRSAPRARRATARAFLQAHARLTSHRSSIALRWSRADAARLATAAASSVTSVRLRDGVRSVELRLPVIHQAFRNDCEAAALAMMLNRKAGQLRLQRELPVARPYEPSTTAGRMVWGDPETGFVGNVQGGGYGVYDLPLLALARRYDPGAENLTHARVAAVIRALRDGRPVVAWIPLGASAPWTWTTPSGTVVHANHAEHAVTLTGWRHGMITYHNPWTGSVETFSRWTFARLWRTLGDRAIAGTSMIRR
jgi:uncharacterized protein YvpB